MNPADLLARIQEGENLHTEFKTLPIHPDDLAAALVAFANTDGGQLILGVEDNRTIAGIADADKVIQKVDQVAYQNCEPPLTVIQETLQVEGKTILIVNIPRGDQRPYRTNQGIYYIRTTGGRRRASRQELLRLFQSAESLYYDESLVLRASLTDIDAHAFAYFIERAYHRPMDQMEIGYEDLLRNLGYLRRQGDREYPTFACLLFFGRDPQRFYPHTHVVAARIPGNDFTQPPSDNKVIRGTLPAILEDAVRFLRIYLHTAHRIQGFEPEVYPELPEEALREVLVNALAHRDYTVTAPVRLFIFDDRVEVRTPGGLPNTVTIEAIRLGAIHVMRNPTIYTLFSRYGWVTGIGTGIYRTIQQVRKMTQKEPVLFLEGNEFIVALPRTPHPAG